MWGKGWHKERQRHCTCILLFYVAFNNFWVPIKIGNIISEPVCGGGRLFPADAVLRLRAGAGQEEREVRGGLPPREGRRHREAQVLRRRHRRQAERQPRQPAAGQVPDQRQEERVPGLQVKAVNQISQNAIFREGPF